MAQRFATALFVSTNSSLMIKKELSGILHGNYSLLLQFEKSKDGSNSEIILIPKKRGNPNFLEGKRFIQDYLDKQVKENVPNSVVSMMAEIKYSNVCKPVNQSLSVNERSKRKFSKTTVNNVEAVNKETSTGLETVAVVNKIEKTYKPKISDCTLIGSSELPMHKASSDMKCNEKSSVVPYSKSVVPQKWQNPLLGWKQATKDTSQERAKGINIVQTQLTSDNHHSGSKHPVPLVIDLKSSSIKAKENINSKDEDECVVVLKEVEKPKELSARGTKRKFEATHQNTSKCEDKINDSVIVIDDEPEDIECKKRRCSVLNDSVVIVEDTNSRRTRKRINRSSRVMGMYRTKEKKRQEFKNKGKQLKDYESALKKDFIPLSSCASVITYVNKHTAFAVEPQESSKKDSVEADTLPIYIDKGKNSGSNTIFQQSTSQNTAPQQQSAPIGDNICSMKKSASKQTGLRPIVIDGSNVAMGHTNGREFSCEGLKICIDYFLERKHKVIAFVPRFRQGKCTNADLLSVLEKRGLVTFTPSRRVNGKLLVSYDDRFIVQYAAECGGVIVSRDNFRDLMNENSNWKETIEKRLLMFTWAGDVLMFPHDPLGRGGPTLEELLRFPD